MCEHCTPEAQARQAEAEKILEDAVAAFKAKPCDCEKHVSNFGRARVMANGDIVYAKKGNEPPPDIEGFTRDPKDPWRFNKKWTPCTFRIQTPLIKPCGAYSIKTLCNHPELPHTDVTFQHCQACPFRK